ncbi:MAG: phosphorylase family protein [Actinomycetota bacterium]
MASLARRMLVAGTVALAVSAFPAARAQTSATCTGRLLVLSAFPAEIGPLLARTTVTSTEVVEGRQFFVGTLESNKVVLALTGIGLVNADNTTRMALDRFGCGSKRAIKGIVFSGVSGGHTYIGDVTVPARWTLDDGKTWYAADRTMLAAAKGAIAAGVSLKSDTPVGDCACTGADPDAATVVHLSHTPEILFGGDGRSSDPFGGRAFPCAPQGGDVFGCQPCRARNVDPQDVARFASGIAPFVDPSFFLGYLQAPPATPAGFDADDMETAAVARVASQRNIPFIGFRSLSDGLGDPLMLPGFPAQFFVYRQLAAENAAAVALAFLRGWAAR